MENLQETIIPTPTPTTNYIEADPTTFKDIVQKLTGGSAHKLRPKPTVSRRRKHSVRDLQVIRLAVESARTWSSNGFSKSPAKVIPATPLGCDSVFFDRAGTESPPSEEERAISEKGFYLHASPMKAEAPVLLNLFPLSSPDT